MNNKLYQIIWNVRLGKWVVTSELAKRGKKRSTARRKALLFPLLSLCSSTGFALPTGSEQVSGLTSITTPSAGHLQINQTSQHAVINWQGFSIGQHETVTIQQPNAQAVQLDRVVGADPSVIQGQLQSNGQVYLVNPNGVVFSNTAQVDVGGLVATTHQISDADFNNGKLHFSQNGATGSVINQGQITTPKGGLVALIGEQIENSGSISTPQGSTVLAAGSTVDLDMQGNGLVEIKVTTAALHAQVTNHGAITADGGQVILTAQSAGQLLQTVVNNDGLIQAHSMVERNGQIVLAGGSNGIVEVSGTLDVSGKAADQSQAVASTITGGAISVSGAQLQVDNGAMLNASGTAGGGSITIGDKFDTKLTTIQAGATLTAQSLDHGPAGNIQVFANTSTGTLNLAGRLDASAPKHGDGGSIETSAAQVNIADSAQVSTQAANGKTGSWLIDPVNFTVAASGGDMTGAALSANLSSNNITLQSINGNQSGSGDINVNDTVNWSANTLTLNAQNNININAVLTASNTASLALFYGQASASGTSSSFNLNNTINLSAGQHFSTTQGSAGTTINYMVITSLGAAGSVTGTDLQGINGNLSGNYVLGANIDASATSSWNNGHGFVPLGQVSNNSGFLGNFNGLNHTITNLFIMRPTENYVGLFGSTKDSLTSLNSSIINNTISNIGLINGNITGSAAVGMLVGESYGTAISNSYSTGSVTGVGVNYTAGLVGWSHDDNASITNSYSTCTVTGTDAVGGLTNQGLDSNQFPVNFNSTVSNSYATGHVTGNTNLGGLIGMGSSRGTVTNSFWDIQSTGQSTSAGGTGLSTAQLMTQSSYTGWDFSKTWWMANGATRPFLRMEYSTSISNADQLQLMASNLSAHYTLAANLDLAAALAPVNGQYSGMWGSGGFVPVGSGQTINQGNDVVTFNITSLFSGSFDGLNHTITGLNINQPNNDFLGLFGAISGTVSNINLTGAHISGHAIMGILAGYNAGHIQNAHSSGVVTSVNSTDIGGIGGLVGYNAVNGTIDNASAVGSAQALRGVGGLVGINYGSVSNSYFAGSVTGNFNFGGLIGNNMGIVNNAHYDFDTTLINGGTADTVGGLRDSQYLDWFTHSLSLNIADYTSLAPIAPNTYSIADLQGLKDLLGFAEDANYTFVLTNNLDLSSLNNPYLPYLAGHIDGAGHTLSNVNLSQNNSHLGLIGTVAKGGSISNLGVININISGVNAVGVLVGINSGTISNSYSTGSSSGLNAVGGLVGVNLGTIINSYSTASVTGGATNLSLPIATNFFTGGLVGNNAGSITNSYAIGSVTQSYSGGINDTGGLVGTNTATISNAFWDTQTTGQSSSAGGAGLNTAQMLQLASYSSWGSSIAATGGTNSVWRIYSGQTMPLLSKFLTPLVLADTSVTYDGLTHIGAVAMLSGIFGSPASGVNLGSYANNYYTSQQGYDISGGNLMILPQPISLPTNQLTLQISNENIAPLLSSLISNNTSLQAVFTFTPSDSTGLSATSSFTMKVVTDTTGDFTGSTPNSLASLQPNAASGPASAVPMATPSSFPSSSSIGSVGVGIISTGNFNPNGITFTPVNFSPDEYHPEQIQPSLQVNDNAPRTTTLDMGADRNSLTLLLADGELRVWDFNAGSQRLLSSGSTGKSSNSGPAQADADHVITAPSGTANSGIGTRGVSVQDIMKEINGDQPTLDTAQLKHFSRSVNGDLMLGSATDNQLSLWDNLQSKKQWHLSYQRGEVDSLAMTKNNRYGAVLSQQPGSLSLNPGLQLKQLTDAVDIVDLGSGKVLHSLPNFGEQVIYMEFKDEDILQLGLANGDIVTWSIAAQQLTPVAHLAEAIKAVDAVDHTYAYILPDGTAQVGNGTDKAKLSIQNRDNPFKYAKLLEGGDKLLTMMENGEMSLWDVGSATKLLRMFSSKQGWTVMDAYGRFDGSEEALENFSWEADKYHISLDSFSENFYEPGLLNNVLHNKDYLNDHVSMVKNGISLPPKIELQLAQDQNSGANVALQLDVFDRGGGIEKINIYQNGKLLNPESVVIAQQVQQVNNNIEHRVLALNISPSAGKNNVKVTASNRMGIETTSSEVSFDGSSKTYTSAVRLLTVGIDKYSDPKLNLSYSVADANLIGASAAKVASVAFSKNLYNEKATKANILAELKELSQGDQQDNLIIYFAGHGVAVGKEWYFLPYETKILPTVEAIAANGVSASELSDIFKSSKMQHILVMIDSCYSGASTGAFEKLQTGQHYFTRQLSRSLGITMITAASKDKEAYELKSLGHGLFTYLMAEDLQQPDIPHTAHGIADDIIKTLPAFSKKMVGDVQEPTVYKKGNDFLISDLAKASAKDTGTPSPAPVAK